MSNHPSNAAAGGRKFLLQGIQQAYWVGQTAALELSVPATYAVDVETSADVVQELYEAVQTLISRHDMLRAVMLPSGEQEILAEVPDFPVVVEDVTGSGEQVFRDTAHRVRSEMASSEFALGTWPQFAIRATLNGKVVRLHLRVALWMMDGWSFEILIRELVQLSIAPGRALPPIEMDFADYVSSRADARSGPRRESAWHYWQQRLANLPGPPALPLTHNALAGQRPVFKHRSTKLSATRWAQITAHCARHRITPSLLACSAYSEVLARYSGSTHFALTLLHSGRFEHLPQAAGVIGNFGTTILLEVDGAPTRSFLERTRLLQRQFWRDLERLAVDGIEVTRAIQQKNSAAPGIGIPVTFTAVSLGGVEPDRGQPMVRVDYDTAHLEVPQVHLDHQLHLGADGSAVFNWDYVGGLFPDGFIDTVCEAHRELIEGLADDPAFWEQYRPQPTSPSEPTPAVAPASTAQRLESLFDAQALATPDRVAIINGERRLTYGELRRRALSLAHDLASPDIQPNQLVAVSLPKGWEQVVAVLGVLYAGAAYVPIDPDLPPGRRNLLLANSQARIVVTNSETARAPDWPSDIERLVARSQPLDENFDEWTPQGTPHDLAYVIFTSGSTGVPKGVMIDHRGAWNTISDLNSRFSVGPGDKLLALSSLSFDLSVYDIFGALAAGAAIVIPDAGRTRDASHWRELVNQHAITIWNSVPALMQLALEGAQHDAMSSLRLVMMSGDWIPLNLPDRVRFAAPNAVLYSLGGATEASIWSNLFEIGEFDPEWRSIPYGHAMEHQSIHVLDETLAECAPWVPGDIYIGGTGVALGYWGDIEKTKASFIVHPRTGSRLYRTGDLGRYLEDGEIEFLGRKDFQVKIQGYRVECAEVEAAILVDQAIKAAVVTAATDLAGTRHLVAYLVPAANASAICTASLRTRLLALLPPYMVPAFFVALAELPLSDNGKVIRTALPPPDFGACGAKAVADRQSPREGLERTVASLWQDVLGVREIGREDNFFALGGSSFAGMRLASRLEQLFKQRITFPTLVSRPTVAALAELLSAKVEEPADGLLTLLRPGNDATPLFCVHPIGGNVACYMPLALHLAPGCPVYGVRAPGMESGGEAPLNSIPAMARRYVEEIRSVQPSGPYHLLGWSLGGLIVQEMAVRLADEGETVALIAMIDSAVPQRQPQTARERFAHFAKDVLAIAGIDMPGDGGEIASRPAEQRMSWLSDTLARLDVPADKGMLEGVYAVFEAGSEALSTHCPSPYAGPAELFLALERPDTADVAREWQRRMPNLTITAMNADHYSIVQAPAIHAIAARIDAIAGERNVGGTGLLPRSAAHAPYGSPAAE